MDRQPEPSRRRRQPSPRHLACPSLRVRRHRCSRRHRRPPRPPRRPGRSAGNEYREARRNRAGATRAPPTPASRSAARSSESPRCGGTAAGRCRSQQGQRQRRLCQGISVTPQYRRSAHRTRPFHPSVVGPSRIAHDSREETTQEMPRGRAMKCLCLKRAQSPSRHPIRAVWRKVSPRQQIQAAFSGIGACRSSSRWAAGFGRISSRVEALEVHPRARAYIGLRFIFRGLVSQSRRICDNYPR